MAWGFVVVAILLFVISFIGAGTGSDAEQIRWARRFGQGGILSSVIALVLFLL